MRPASVGSLPVPSSLGQSGLDIDVKAPMSVGSLTHQLTSSPQRNLPNASLLHPSTPNTYNLSSSIQSLSSHDVTPGSSVTNPIQITSPGLEAGNQFVSSAQLNSLTSSLPSSTISPQSFNFLTSSNQSQSINTSPSLVAGSVSNTLAQIPISSISNLLTTPSVSTVPYSTMTSLSLPQTSITNIPSTFSSPQSVSLGMSLPSTVSQPTAAVVAAQIVMEAALQASKMNQDVNALGPNSVAGVGQNIPAPLSSAVPQTQIPAGFTTSSISTVTPSSIGYTTPPQVMPTAGTQPLGGILSGNVGGTALTGTNTDGFLNASVGNSQLGVSMATSQPIQVPFNTGLAPTSVNQGQIAIQVSLYIQCTCTSDFLIGSYGTPLAQRASYLALHSSLFGPDGVVNYDYNYYH